MPRHDHPITVDEKDHSHGLDLGLGQAGVGRGANSRYNIRDNRSSGWTSQTNTPVYGTSTGITVTIDSQGAREAFDNRPRFFVMVYIMKL